MTDDLHPAIRDRTIPLAVRCRLAFVSGVLERWAEAHDRPATATEFEKLLEGYPGDPEVIAEREGRRVERG